MSPSPGATCCQEASMMHCWSSKDDDITTAIEKLETQKSIISSFSQNINPRVSQSVSMPASAWSSQSSQNSTWTLPSSQNSWISSSASSSSCASTPSPSTSWFKQSNYSSWSSSDMSKNSSNGGSSSFVFSSPAQSEGFHSRESLSFSDSRSTSSSISSYQNDRLLQMD